MFAQRWFMFDNARERTFSKNEFNLLLELLAKLGYNGLGLYIEGAFAFETLPGVIREGVMTPADAAWLKTEAHRRGITVFPMTNVVGHRSHNS